jgi:hypothetical protein
MRRDEDLHAQFRATQGGSTRLFSSLLSDIASSEESVSQGVYPAAASIVATLSAVGLQQADTSTYTELKGC